MWNAEHGMSQWASRATTLHCYSAFRIPNSALVHIPHSAFHIPHSWQYALPVESVRDRDRPHRSSSVRPHYVPRVVLEMHPAVAG